MQNGYDHRFPQPRNPWKQLKYEENTEEKNLKKHKGGPFAFLEPRASLKNWRRVPPSLFSKISVPKNSKGSPLCFLEIFFNDTLYSSIVSMVFGVVEHDGASSFAPNTFPTLIYGIEYLVPTHSDPKTLKNNMENL